MGSVVALLLAAGAFIWRLVDPAVLSQLQGANVLYLVLILLVVVVVSVVASYGAILTFPVPKKLPTRKELEQGEAGTSGAGE